MSSSQPNPILSRLQNTGQFLAFVAQRFHANKGQSTAAALAYTTLLALVPLLTVGFAVLTAFPVFETLSQQLQDYIFQNFVPATGEQVQAYLERFVTRASGLTLFGLVFLVVTSIALIFTIERALNSVWRVSRQRRPLAAFLVYWAVLTLGPGLLAGSITMSSYLLAAADTLEATASLRLPLLKLTPTLATWGAFSLLYLLVPNRRVNFGHALLGAALAALLFEAAKKGFALYVTNFPGYETIYGALATLLLFQIWIYLCWLIILLGAEFAAALSSYRQPENPTRTDPTLYHGLLLLGQLWDRQKEGGAVRREQLLQQIDSISDRELAALLGCFSQASILERTVDKRWLLARDLDNLTVSEVEDALDSHALRLPTPSAELDPRSEAIRTALEALQAQRTTAGHSSVAALLASQAAGH